VNAQKLTLRKRIYERVNMLIDIVTSGDYKNKFGEGPHFWLVNHNSRSKNKISNAVTLYQQLEVDEETAKRVFGACAENARCSNVFL
jgi:hypothetical protein